MNLMYSGRNKQQFRERLEKIQFEIFLLHRETIEFDDNSRTRVPLKNIDSDVQFFLCCTEF